MGHARTLAIAAAGVGAAGAIPAIYESLTDASGELIALAEAEVGADEPKFRSTGARLYLSERVLEI